MAQAIGTQGAQIGPSPLGDKPFVSKWSNRYRGVCTHLFF
jgi:hypothetical protein